MAYKTSLIPSLWQKMCFYVCAWTINSTLLAGDCPQLHHAQHLKISSLGQGYVVEILAPWPGSQKSFQTLLWPKGQALPVDNRLPVIMTPVGRIVTQSTTCVGMLDALDSTSRIVAVSVGKYLHNAKMTQDFREGRLKEVGEQGQLNIEALIDLQPDVVLTYALNVKEAPFLLKLERSKIPHLVMGSFTESSALARSEWMKLLGLLLGKSSEAEATFKNIEKNYADLCAKVMNVKSKPKVFFNLPFGGVWHLPQGQSWMVKLVVDAGASYPWLDTLGEGSLQLTAESVFDKALDADVWINPSQDPKFSIASLLGLDRRYGEFLAVKNKKCLVPSLQVNEFGGNNFYQLGAARPDLILADIIFHLHPEILPEHQPVFYRWMPSSL